MRIRIEVAYIIPATPSADFAKKIAKKGYPTEFIMANIKDSLSFPTPLMICEYGEKLTVIIAHSAMDMEMVISMVKVLPTHILYIKLEKNNIITIKIIR